MAVSTIEKNLQPCCISNRTAISVSNDVAFTPTVSGYFVCSLTTNSGASTAPFVQLESFNSGGTSAVITSAWGVPIAGAGLTVTAPIKAGERYRVHALRCSINGSAFIYT